MRTGIIKTILVLLSLLFLYLGVSHAEETIVGISDVFIEELDTSQSFEDLDVEETINQAEDVRVKGMIYTGIMFLLTLICVVTIFVIDS
jgi:hypothetical protein